MNGERWQKIERLFHEALTRQGLERAAFLAENCAGDDELRKEIEGLIASHELPENFIERDACDLAAEMLAGGSSGVVEGQTVGPYKILELLGAGGMGQVFRATDTRLHRTVTIKILPAEKVSDPERKRRFLQEARAASALNHPNIVMVYDIANDGDMDYLVMEYVEGKSLDKLMVGKRLPLADAIGYVAQIAGALAAAHSAGIVHRDIKPANVIVTPESQVKVLDFGLAKLTEREKSAETETVEGAIMGTPAYMSPEQASGRQVDHRTDIFSLGVMLYELVAGKRPFAGNSHVDTMHQIINAPAPPLANIPPRLADIVDKALAKDPRERYQNAGDLAVDLRRVLSKPDSLPRVVPLSADRARFVRWMVTAVVVLGAGVAVWLSNRPANFTLENAEFIPLTNSSGEEVSPAISSDGKFIVFLADLDGASQKVVLIQVDDPNNPLHVATKAGVSLGTNRNLGFTRDMTHIWLQGAPNPERFRLIPLFGRGSEKTPLDEKASVAEWSPDGMRVVYNEADLGDAIWVADQDGSNPHRILQDPPGMHNHYPAWSHDMKWIYVVRGREPGLNMDLWRIPLDGGPPEQLTTFERFISHPTPIDDRNVLYIGKDQNGCGPWLWAFDPEEKVSRRLTMGTEKYSSVSAALHGHRLIASVIAPEATLWSVPIPRNGRIVEESAVKPYEMPSARALMPRFGRKSLFYLSSHGCNDGLWRIPLDGGPPTEVLKAPLLEPPAVSRDEDAVVVRRNGKKNLFLIPADGSQKRTLASTVEVRGAPAFSPDGKWIATGGNDGTVDGLFKIPLDGGLPVSLVAGPASNPVWSPDGSVIAYVGRNERARQPVYLVRSDGTAEPSPLGIDVGADGWRMQFLDDNHLIYMKGLQGAQDFWMLNLTTHKQDLLTKLDRSAIMTTFDITPDRTALVFDRLKNNSDITLIEPR